MASHVRIAMGDFSTAQARIVAKRGESELTINVFAVVVNVSAIMKQVNITAHISPEIAPPLPLARTYPTVPARPRAYTNQTISVSAQKKLRQNVTSKLLALSRWRVKTPAMLHKNVAPIMSRMARRCCCGVVINLRKRRRLKWIGFVGHFGHCQTTHGRNERQQRAGKQRTGCAESFNQDAACPKS